MSTRWTLRLALVLAILLIARLRGFGAAAWVWLIGALVWAATVPLVLSALDRWLSARTGVDRVQRRVIVWVAGLLYLGLGILVARGWLGR